MRRPLSEDSALVATPVAASAPVHFVHRVRELHDALEARYPVLRGAVRDRETKLRRAFIRFFACEQDLSHESPDSPPEVAAGTEPYLIVGAMAGG